MSEQDFHDQMLAEYKKQRAKGEPCPKGTDPSAWSNRYYVAAKLPGDLYFNLFTYCKKHDLSMSRAIKFLLFTHPFLKNNG